MTVPRQRIRVLRDEPATGEGEFVLYWMTAHRRTRWNFALDRAVEWAVELRRPLIVLEALRAGYPWASDRLHTFVLQGMSDNASRLQGTPVAYYPYVEPEPDAGKGLVAALAARAAVVVTDDFPAFFLRRMTAAAAESISRRVEAVDANGLMPLAATDRVYPTAYAFRLFLHRSLRPHLAAFPKTDALAGTALQQASIPADVTARWPCASRDLLGGPRAALERLPIDHRVGAVPVPGGQTAAQAALDEFLQHRLDRYREDRNQPEQRVASGLSSYLHFGHISVHEVFSALMTRERWTTRRLSGRVSGQREGWWGASPAAESFLDELITWRELGFNMCHHSRDYDRYESLPVWARTTLDAHASDPRPYLYTRDELEQGGTHDPLWNAAQVQLVTEGRIHNYLRMLWGKKILEWSPTPREALAAMIDLNNKYALDGRDPNSYSGIFWVLGRYDRPWVPERPIFGRVRYMSSDNTARKVRVREYIRRYAR